MKSKLSIIFSVLLLLVSCEKAEVQNATQLSGMWEVNEFDGLYDGLLYECGIQPDENRENYFYIRNFLDLISDPRTLDENYRLSVKIEGSRLIILPQSVGDVEILDGSGRVRSKNDFEISYRYLANGVTYNATAIFIRILE